MSKQFGKKHPLFWLPELDSPEDKLLSGDYTFKDDVVEAYAEGEEVRGSLDDLLTQVENTPPPKRSRKEDKPKPKGKPKEEKLHVFKDEEMARKGLVQADGYEAWFKMNVGEVESPPPPPPPGTCMRCGRLPCIVEDEETVEYGDAIVCAFASQEAAGMEVKNEEIRFELYKMYAHALGYFHKRKELPLCVIDFIRFNFPQKDGNYVGFKAGTRGVRDILE